MDHAFKAMINEAMATVKTILDNNRNPVAAGDVHHAYGDKFLLANFTVNTANAATLNALELVGLDSKCLSQLKGWAENRSVTLRLQSTEKCKFLREEKRDVESATKSVSEYSVGGANVASVTHKTVTTITEYFWQFDVDWSIIAFQGNDPTNAVVLKQVSSNCEIKTTAKSSPRPDSHIPAVQDINITWLLQQINQRSELDFSIDRSDPSTCHTPRRNKDIANAMLFYQALTTWCRGVESYIRSYWQAQGSHSISFTDLNSNSVFVPVLPLFEDKKGPADATDAGEGGEGKNGGELVRLTWPQDAKATSPILSLKDINAFLREQRRTIDSLYGRIDQTFPADGKKLITQTPAKLIATVFHLVQVSQKFAISIHYIEELLRQQIIAAIGKVVTPVDFAEYMRFHNSRLFREAFEPRQFCYAIRRPDHFPEGTLSIEENLNNGSAAQPIPTCVRHLPAEQAGPMKFRINAATNITFHGDRYLHAYVMHKFSGQSGSNLNLVARSRQFSSFILLVGTIASRTQFQPLHGCIIQNKDELVIPLLMNTIPTPKEFKDAISSLSPEQQRFCKAFRSMQLASTLFGVAIIQIKPQMEKVLNLADDSLTKEIKLTQDLQELFIKYQIPSDLMSWGGSGVKEIDEKVSAQDKLEAVKGHVKAIQEVIEQAKQAELRAVEEEAKFNVATNFAELRRESSFASDSDWDDEEEDCCEEAVSFSAAPSQRHSLNISIRRKKDVCTTTSTSTSAPKSESKPAPSKPVSKPTDDTKSSGDAKEGDAPSATSTPAASGGGVDFSKIPKILNARFLKLDTDSALRPTIIKTGDGWSKKEKKALLAKVTERSLNADDQKIEKNSAFDLLDALSRSGILAFDQASLHIVCAATHCFDQTLMDTVLKENVNPIEKVERSVLIVASTIHDQPTQAIIADTQIKRVATFSPQLFPHRLLQDSQE